MATAVAYMRFSSHNQDENSIEMQRTGINDFAAKHGFEIIDEFVDAGITGREDDRPSFTLMCHKITKKRIQVDAIIIYKMSRLFRSTGLWEIYEDRLDDAGVKVISATEPLSENEETAAMQKGITRLFDQHASKITSVLVKDGMKQIVKKGYWAGGIAPFGYRIEKIDNREGDRSNGEIVKRAILVSDDCEAPIVRRAFQIAAETGKGAALVLKQLALEFGGTIVGRMKRPMEAAGLSLILKDPIYKGLFHYNKTKGKIKYDFSSSGQVSKTKKVRRPQSEWITIQHEDWRHVSDEIWEAAQACRAKNREHYRQHVDNKRPAFALTGIGLCGHCGYRSFGGRWHVSRSKDRSRDYYYYRCRRSIQGAHLCTNKTKICGVELEKAVLNRLLSEFMNPAFVDDIAKEIIEILKTQAGQGIDAPFLEKRDKELAAEQERLIALAQKVVGSIDALAERLVNAENERKTLQKQLSNFRDKIELPSMELLRCQRRCENAVNQPV